MTKHGSSELATRATSLFFPHRMSYVPQLVCVCVFSCNSDGMTTIETVRCLILNQNVCHYLTLIRPSAWTMCVCLLFFIFFAFVFQHCVVLLLSYVAYLLLNNLWLRAKGIFCAPDCVSKHFSPTLYSEVLLLVFRVFSLLLTSSVKCWSVCSLSNLLVVSSLGNSWEIFFYENNANKRIHEQNYHLQNWRFQMIVYSAAAAGMWYDKGTKENSRRHSKCMYAFTLFILNFRFADVPPRANLRMFPLFRFLVPSCVLFARARTHASNEIALYLVTSVIRYTLCLPYSI